MIKTDIKGNVSAGARSEIEAYLSLLSQQKETWETEFNMAELVGNKDVMYERFVDMINYGMIPVDDYRLCEKNAYATVNGERVQTREKYKGFDGVTSTKKPIYNPKGSSYIGLWIFGWLPRDTGFIVQNYNHWGIRAEKGYEAPVVFPANYWPIEVKLVDNVPNAEQAAAGLCKALSDNGQALSDTYKADVTNFFRSGYQRVYTIKCNKWAVFDKDIGYIQAAYDFKSGKPVAKIHINWKVVIRKFIDVRAFANELKKAMAERFSDFDILLDQAAFNKAIEIQKDVINKNNKFSEKHNGEGAITVS